MTSLGWESNSPIIFLKIPCMLQRLSCLSVVDCWMLEVIESKSSNLSSICVNGNGENIKLSLGEALRMKDLRMSYTNAIYYARAELPSIMPNLETLELGSENEVILITLAFRCCSVAIHDTVVQSCPCVYN